MKKLYFLIVFTIIGFAAEAQHYQLIYYDSLSFHPPIRLMTPLAGVPTDAILGHRANGRVTKLAHNQLQINFSQLLGKPTTLSGYGITDGVTTSAMTSALSNKENTISTGSTAQYYRGDKTWQTLNSSSVGLGNVSNTAPLDLPISTATQTALNGKYNNPTGITSQYIRGDGSLATFPTIPAQVNLTAGNRISITGTYPNLTIAYVEPSINQVSRNVNTNYTVGTKQATVYYSIPVTATNPLLAGTSVGSAFLEYSLNAGSTWTTAISTSASSQVGLSVTVSLTTGGSNILSGVIPANALVRIRTTTSGTATVGNATGQEVL